MSSSCRIIAHRGAWGTAAPSAPAENTLEAFEAAIALGADMIELDVRRTRDGHLIVFHDLAQDQRTGAPGGWFIQSS